MLGEHLRDMVAADQDQLLFFAGSADQQPMRVYRNDIGLTELTREEFATLTREAKTLCGGAKVSAPFPAEMLPAGIHSATLRWLAALASDSFAITLVRCAPAAE